MSTREPARPRVHRGPAFVAYRAADMMADTADMDVWAELAYRRISDAICTTGKPVEDGPTLAFLTKTGRRWPAVRAKLVDGGWLIPRAGKLSIARCEEMVSDAMERIGRASLGGHAKAANARIGASKPQDTSADFAQDRSANPLKNNDTAPAPAAPKQVLLRLIEREEKTEKEENQPPTEVGAAGAAHGDEWDMLRRLDDPKAAPAPAAAKPEPQTPEERLKAAERQADGAMVEMLVRVGVPRSSAWGMFGQWKNAIGKEALVKVIRETERDHIQGPAIGWIRRKVQAVEAVRAGRYTMSGRERGCAGDV